MNLFNFKAVATAVALAVPMLASAANLSGKDFTSELTFSVGASNPSSLYDVVVIGSWTDMTYKLGSGPTFVNDLDDSSFQYFGKGLKDSFAGSTDVGQTTLLSFAGLSAGNYTIKFKGSWDNVDVTGKPKDWTVVNGTTSLALGQVSPVPEPESYAMLLAGLGLMGTIVARRRRHGDQA